MNGHDSYERQLTASVFVLNRFHQLLLPNFRRMLRGVYRDTGVWKMLGTEADLS
jgi:hypothetical protein